MAVEIELDDKWQIFMLSYNENRKNYNKKSSQLYQIIFRQLKWANV